MTTATTGGGQYSPNIQKLLSDIENYGKFDYTGQSGYKEVLDRILGYGDFGYDKQAQLDAALQKVTGPEGFVYDPATDPTWGSYKKIYSREGDRAAQNAMVQASMATGGMPSSYAVTAAQQAQNYYNGKMADILPTLRQNAYQEALTALSALTSDRDTKYGVWQDGYNKLQSDLGALQADRDMEYGQWSDYLSVLQNALGNYQTQDQMAYEKQKSAYGDLLTLITTTGYVPDAATLAAAGMSAEEAAAWKAYYDATSTPKVSASYYAPTTEEGVVTQSVEPVAPEGGGEIDYTKFTNADWDAYFASLPADQVSATALWLQNTYGISPHTLNAFVVKYGPKTQANKQNSSAGKSTGIHNMANMLK